MKNAFVGAVLTPILLCALSASAQDAPAPAAPAQPPMLIDPALFKLYLDVAKDLKRLTGYRGTMKERVELARDFSFSGETKAELRELFGNDDPLHLSVEDLPGGGALIHGKSDALDYADTKSGATMHIEPVVAEATVDRAYRAVKFNWDMPGMKLASPRDSSSLEVGNIRVNGEHTVGPFNFPVGRISGRVDRMRIAKDDSSALDFNDLTFEADSAARKKLLDMRYDYRIASVDWGKDKIENLNADIAVINLDPQALEALADSSESAGFGLSAGSQLDAAQTEAAIKLFRRFALDLSRHNGAIEIRDISAQYHGQTAGLSGRVMLPNVNQADLESMQKTYEKLVVRLRLHVPLDMIDEIAHSASRAMMEAQARQNGVEITDMAVDLVARGLVGKMTDTLVKQQKWAHMEKNELVTVFELKKGKMYLDGHVVNAKSNPFMAMAQGK